MSVRRAVLVSSIERYYTFLVAFASSIVISRLLSPSEIGAFSIAMSIAGVASVIREFGASSFLIRAPVLERHHESCAFGLSLLLDFCTGALLVIVAPQIGAFFNNEEVCSLLRFLSLNFFIIPFGTVKSSLLRREMHFDVIARIGLISATAGMIGSIGFALLKFGAISLAYGAVALTLTSALLTIAWGPKRPLRLPRLRGASELVTFGLQTTGLSIIWEINDRLPDFMIGRISGMHDAGLLSRASSLVNNVNDLLLRGIGSVALPYLSKVERESGGSQRVHLRMSSIMTAIGWPTFAAVALLASPLTLVLYGEKWLEIVWPVRLYCLLMCIALPFSFQSQLVIAKGRLASQIRASLFMLPIRIVFLVVGAIQGGIIGLSIAAVVCFCIGIIVGSLMVWKEIGVKWADYGRTVRENSGPLVASAGVSALYFLLPEQFHLGHVAEIGLYSALILIAVVISLNITRHQIIGEIKSILEKRNHA